MLQLHFHLTFNCKYHLPDHVDLFIQPNLARISIASEHFTKTLEHFL